MMSKAGSKSHDPSDYIAQLQQHFATSSQSDS